MAEGSSQEKAKKKMIKLQSRDGAEFEVEKAVAIQSQMIQNMIEEGCVEDDAAIPIPNITGSILSIVLTYCTNHGKPPPPTPTFVSPEDAPAPGSSSAFDLKKLDRELVNNMDMDGLFELMLAANYLDISGLLDLTCQTVADEIKDMSPEEVREVFNIENDFTPEEEKQVRKENAWAFNNIPN